MTDASPHPLIGSTVEGYTLHSVRATGPCSTDFEASKPQPAGGVGDAVRARVRVWHDQHSRVPDDVPRHAPGAADDLPRRHRMLRAIRARVGRAHPPRETEDGFRPEESPERVRREELNLASDRSVRSEAISRPLVLSITDPSIAAPFGACEAALFPPVGVPLGSFLRSECIEQRDGHDRPERCEGGGREDLREESTRLETSDLRLESTSGWLACAVLLPVMNGVIEMLESGYRLNSLRLDALAGDESGSIVVVDAPLSVGSRERDSETPTGRALDIPARGALAVLTPLVDELSVLLQSGAANNSETPTLSSQWISWCAQIEDASARATLTLLEARLWAEASTAEKPPVAAQAHPVYDEAAPTEVDAARGGSNPDESPG